jgi:pimeloyl-ACP methyl ester carboxylesterase
VPPSLPQLPEVEVAHRHVAGVHVATAGAGEPIVLVHGWPEHWWCWRRVIGPLATRRRVICLDLPGFGWSDPSPVGYTKEALAARLVAALDALDVRSFDLVGHDWGGYLAFLIALRHPERVKRLLALGIIHPWLGLDLGTVGTLWRVWYQLVLATPGLGAWGLRTRPALLATLMRGWGGGGTALDDEAVRLYSDCLREPVQAAASARLYRTFLTREFAPLAAGRYRAARLRAPTLLVCGQRDPVIRPAQLAGPVPQADELRIRWLPGVGHFVPEERPEVVLDWA